MRRVKVTEHPLKKKVQESRLCLWEIRHLMGGSPSEARLSRVLNGIERMPENLERRLKKVLDEGV